MEIANWKFKGGFTLVEFVVVIGILGFTVGATMLFLNSVLKGANQTNVTQEVKQNGQIVLDSLDRQIRGAVDAVGLDTPPDFQIIKLSRLSEDPLYIKCFVDGASGVRNNRVASAVFSGAGIPADSVFTSISNGDTVRGVNITNCRFNVVSAAVSAQGAQVPAIVTVAFDVDQGLDAPNRQDFSASASFVTTISLRTY